MRAEAFEIPTLRSLRAKVDKGFAVPLLHTVRGAGYVLDDQPR